MGNPNRIRISRNSRADRSHDLADAALKAANVKLLGFSELTNGLSWVTVKITGDVAAVQAA